jgi:hypothetical protein
MYTSCPALLTVSDAPVTGNFVLDKVHVNTLTFENEAGGHSSFICTDALHNRNPLLMIRMCLVSSIRGALIDNNSHRLFFPNSHVTFIHFVLIFVGYEEGNLLIDTELGTKYLPGWFFLMCNVQLLAYNT